MSDQTCHGKKCYSKRDAETARNARTTGRRRVRHGRPEYLRVYHCDECNHWHLTSKKNHEC